MYNGKLTKSDFKMGMKCPKHLWLTKHRPELIIGKELSYSQREGLEIGRLASHLFDMESVTPEVTIVAGDLLCRVDYLEKTDDGVIINEVKAKDIIRKNKVTLKPELLYDFAFQYHVLVEAGLNVKKVNCIYLNKEYKRHGELDYNELFVTEDVTDDVMEYVMSANQSISDDIDYLREYLKRETIEEDAICSDCRDCEMASLCWRNVPMPSVWDLNGSHSKKRGEWYKEGLVTYEQLLDSGVLGEKAEKQVRAELYGEEFVNKGEIESFLKTIHYPVYYLDFETYSVAVPEYDNQWPYEPVPFQFSLHYITEEGGELHHKEYLANENVDPRREIAEALVRDIPAGACVTAYYKPFECGRLRELAELFPDLSERLLEIRDSVVDFIVPFRNYHYLTKGMEGKSSIKKVAPALFPDDASLNYANLPGVKKGDEAMEMFLKLRSMGAEEREKTREDMLKYCELDTYAMVKIHEALEATAGEEEII